jgi:hypothetical protein
MARTDREREPSRIIPRHTRGPHTRRYWRGPKGGVQKAVRRQLPTQEVAGEPETEAQAARRERAAERQRGRYDRASETARKREYRARKTEKIKSYQQSYYAANAARLKEAARERKRAQKGDKDGALQISCR